MRGNETRVEFSERVGIKFDSYTNYERGTRSPDAEAIEKIRRATNVSLHWLFTGEGEIYLDEIPVKPLDAELMEAVVVTVAEFQAQNRRVKIGPEKLWLVYMECYRKIAEDKGKYPPEEMRTQLKERCRDLLKLAVL